MRAYDFDGTIYDGDSTVDFYLFAIKTHPALAVTLPKNLLNAIRFKLGRISRQEFKQRYFQAFLPRIDVESAVRGFWNANGEKLKPWYLGQRSDDDVIASASPEFLLRPICEELGVRLLASKVDARSGIFVGPNLRGDEKVRAFTAAFPGETPAAFYTDDLQADAPMASFAHEVFVVKGAVVRRDSRVLS